jgi:uncharacterized protein (DUF2236 family)
MTAGVAHRINGERLVLLGWSRAILLQMAHPLIAAGVVDHSSFRASPLTAARRLKETIRAMLGLTFGDDDAHARVVGRILAIHRRVNGRLRERVGSFPEGTPYSAEDPELVLWVHATVIESTVLAYEALVGPLSATDRDTYCDEAAPVAVELGARADEVPRTWDALLRHLGSVSSSGVLAVGADARVVAGALLYGTLSPVTKPLAWGNRLITVGWLPPPIRAAYGLAWDPADERWLARVLGAIRRLRRITPAFAARWPAARRPAPLPR